MYFYVCTSLTLNDLAKVSDWLILNILNAQVNSWHDFCFISGNFRMIGDDLVNSYHLLLCCLDLVFCNALMCSNKKELINQYFRGKTPFTSLWVNVSLINCWFSVYKSLSLRRQTVTSEYIDCIRGVSCKLAHLVLEYWLNMWSCNSFKTLLLITLHQWPYEIVWDLFSFLCYLLKQEHGSGLRTSRLYHNNTVW